MEKFIKIFHIYERRDVDNLFAFFTGDPLPYPYTPKIAMLWFIGLKLWGNKFITCEAKLKNERDDFHL